MRKIETIRLEKKFIITKISEETIAGMTLKNAGNFYPKTNDAAFESSNKILKIIGYDIDYLNKRKLIMINKADIRPEIVFLKQPEVKTKLLFYEGIIYRGNGALMFFPGGCPGIVFRDDNANLSGLFHGGWRIIAQGIIEQFLKQWETCGGKWTTTRIKILPGICVDCLTFDQDFFSNIVWPMLKPIIPKELAKESIVKKIDRKIGLDLVAIIDYLITKKGYYVDSITLCTCHIKNFWCYRCDDKNGKKYRNGVFLVTAPLSSDINQLLY
ncbi:MAG: laccase domain-containing protein [Patescibacteria group bacterium]